jgi:hypothetical protein
VEFTTLNRGHLIKALTPGYVSGITLETVNTTKFQTVCQESESWRSPRRFRDQMDCPGSPRIRSMGLIHTERPTGDPQSTSMRHTLGEFRTHTR